MYDRLALEGALRALGDVLADRGEAYQVVAIGGGALSLRGLIQRSTEDIDLIGVVHDGVLVSAEPLPAGLRTAIADVALLVGSDRWMNGEPTSLLIHGLPSGFLDRCERRTYGGLTILLADRVDQIHLKLFAISAPNDKHHADLRALSPTAAELVSAAQWARTQATGEGFEMELRATLATFGVELGDD